MNQVLQSLLEQVEPYPVLTSKLLYEAPPPSYIIEGVLQRTGITGLTGFPGTGKTWLSLEMMRAIITGTPFLGQFPAHQSPVLFVGQDASLLDYAQQWRRLTKHFYDQEKEAYLEKEQDHNPYDVYPHFLLQSEFTLDDPVQIARMVKTSMRVWTLPITDYTLTPDGWETVELTQQHYGLIIYDTLSKMTHAPENDNTARDIVFSHLRDIAEATGATLLVLHHNALQSEFRSGEEWRGAGSQFGALDAHFHLTAKKKDLIQFKVKKFRGITPEPFEFTLDVHDRDKVATLSYLQPAEEKESHQDQLLGDIVSLLISRGNKPMTAGEMAVILMTDTSLPYADAYGEDGTKLQKSISATLPDYVRRQDAKLVKLPCRGARGAALYKLTPTVGGEEDAVQS